MKECKPYCLLLENMYQILAIYPFGSIEANHAAAEARKAIIAIEERKFAVMYHDLRKEFNILLRKLEDREAQPCRKEK